MSHAPSPYPAASRTQGPGTFLLLVGILNIVAALLFVGFGAAFGWFGDLTKKLQASFGEEQQKARKMLNSPEVKNLTKEDWAKLEEIAYSSFWARPLDGLLFRPGMYVWAGLPFFGSILLMVAGSRMRKLRSYGLCVVASVLAMFPLLYVPCCLGQLAGLWALIVLLNADVKAAFR